MAKSARGQSAKAKNQAMAERMKRLGIRRTTGRCPICYKVVALPIDKHFFNC